MIITNEFIELGKSERGGWTRKQLALLGVSWPPPHGWKGRIIGKEISWETSAAFLEGKKVNWSHD